MIQAIKLGRCFGDRDVFCDLDLDVPKGAFLMVSGSNGSGKSTLLSLFAGLLAPTSGDLRVGVPRSEIGYLGHESLVYKELTPLENLNFFGCLYRVSCRHKRIEMLLKRYGLWEVRSERVSTFSRGMVQRLALCRTLLHDPGLVLLDEPYAGLDAAGIELLDIDLAEICSTKTLVISSHLPERIEHLVTLRFTL